MTRVVLVLVVLCSGCARAATIPLGGLAGLALAVEVCGRGEQCGEEAVLGLALGLGVGYAIGHVVDNAVGNSEPEKQRRADKREQRERQRQQAEAQAEWDDRVREERAIRDHELGRKLREERELRRTGGQGQPTAPVEDEEDPDDAGGEGEP